MLGWWSGTGVQLHDQDDENTPETPAPVFAARAFRSAIFGTPHPIEHVNTRASVPILSRSKDDNDIMPSSISNQPSESPSKKQGILLTPGTIGRRKTVSFGAGVVDNEGKKGGVHGRSGIPNDCPGRFPSPYTPKVVNLPEPVRQTSLTKRMENSREKKKPTRTNLDTVPKLDAHISPVKQSVIDHRVSHEEDVTDSREESDSFQKSFNLTNLPPDSEGDMTFDLNKPHSQSGRYWKSEYERYHQEAFEEMKKLVKYRELAKSFAKKKDTEAMNLSMKLKEEQQKVAMMEEKVAQLSAHIAERRTNSKDDHDAPDLMRQLARQQALTEQYRTEVNSFQQAMEDQKVNDPIVGDQRRTLYKIQRELKKAREQLKDMNSLRSELHTVRLSVSAAERKISKLTDENAKLTTEVIQVKEDLRKSELRCQSAESRVKESEMQEIDVRESRTTTNSNDERAATREELRALRRQRALLKQEDQPFRVQETDRVSAGQDKSRRHDNYPDNAEKYERDWKGSNGTGDIEDEKLIVPTKEEKLTQIRRRRVLANEKATVSSAAEEKATSTSKAADARKARAALLEHGDDIVTKVTLKPASNALRSIPIFELNKNIPRSDGNKAYDFKRTVLAKHTSDAFNVGLAPSQQVYPQVRAGAAARQRRLSNAAAPRAVASRVATPRKVLLPEKAEAARRRLEQRNALKKRAAETAEASAMFMSTIR